METSLFWFYRISRAGAAFALFASVSPCQQTSPADPTQRGVAQRIEKPESRRILGIIPNYRTAPSLQNYKPLTNGKKFKIASQDALDRGTVALAALFANEGQLANANRSFGQGGAGFSLAVSFFAFQALISVSELSFAVPATAATCVLETILAKYLLGSMSTGAARREQPWSPVAWLYSCCKVLRIARSLCCPLSFRFITKSRRFFLSTSA
jgi:hypothetical protein